MQNEILNVKTPNKRQQECIDNIEGKVMVLAGPGTGKTFTVTKRIASMINKGIKPSSILCLTFSDAAASEMKSRLNSEIGILASSVNIYTYHSFCNEIIKMYPDSFGIASDVSLINSALERELLVESIDEANLEYFVADRGGKYFHISTFKNAIAKLKSLRINKENYLNNIESNPNLMPRILVLKSEIEEKQKKGDNRITTRLNEIQKIENNIEKAKELWKIYEIYSRKMIEHNLIDFADMINLVIDKFERDKGFLFDVSNNYKYFMVDEYQDTNDLQNKILFDLLEANESKNIFVVGDDDQIIYGFQGANSENVDNFLKKYPDTKVICLVENNRSTQNILDLSYRIVTQDSTRLENNPLFKSHNIEKKLKAVNKEVIAKEQKIKRWQFGELVQEYNYIVDDIVKLVNSSKCPTDNKTEEKKLSEIAIISTKRSELKEFEELLKSKNIPCQLNEGQDIFQIRSVICTYFYLKALNNQISDSDKLFGLLLTEPFCINLNDYNVLFNEFKRTLTSSNDFINNMKKLKNWTDEKKIKNFVETFEKLKKYAASNNLRDTIIEVINQTRIINFFFSCETNKMENILGIKKLIDEATDLMRLDKSASLNDFVKKLEYARENEIDIVTDKSSVVQNAIQLVTYHGSKGREFEYVYLPNLLENNWEKFRMPGEYKLITEPVEEEGIMERKKDSELLKKLFVGITRAKYGLVISHSDNVDRKPKAITKYINVVADFDFEKTEFEYKEEDFIKEIYKSLSRETIDHRKVFENQIKEKLKGIILSPSSLNSYNRCPKLFFYTSVLNIDVTETNWDSANFGNIIHSILEKSAKKAMNKEGYYNKEEALSLFNQEMDLNTFKDKESKEKFYDRGLKFLDNYYKHFIEFPSSIIEGVEESFDNVCIIGDDFLKGKIDRIEKNSDGTYSLYDYKTSKYTSVNQMCIGGSREEYYNQLCCYKLAYETKYKERKVSKVGIIYVEDNKIAELSLIDEDTDYIKNLIHTTYENIKELKFSEKTEKDETVCKLCAYKDLCRLDVI